ncbi:hypothetical protein LSAT2_004551, partial [Lamellibrachia satsuma]
MVLALVDDARFQISPPPPSHSGRNAGVGRTQRLGRITASPMNEKSHGRQRALDASYLPRDNPVKRRPSRA